MNDITVYEQEKLDAQSVAQAQQVLLLLFLNPKMSVAEACRQTNITVDKYRYWLAKGEDVINRTRELIENQQRVLISEIATTRIAIIHQMMKDATDELTKPLERAKLFEVLSAELEELQAIYNVRPGIEQDAQEYLKRGPKIEKQESRFASIDIEETDSGFRIGLNESKDIIDVDV